MKFRLRWTPYERSTFYMVLSAFVVSLNSLFTKVGIAEIPLSLLIFLRFFLPLCALLVLFLFIPSWGQIRGLRFVSLQIWRGICEVMSQLALFVYISYRGDLINTALFWSSSPIYMPLIGCFFSTHRMDRSLLWRVVLGLLGILLIAKPDRGFLDSVALIGIFSGFFSAVSQVLNGVSQNKYRVEENLFYFFLVTSVLSFFVLFFDIYILGSLREGDIFFELTNPTNWFAWIIVGVATLVLQILRALAFQATKPTQLAPFFYLPVFVSGLFGFLFYGETLDWIQLCGSFLVIASSFLGFRFR